MNNDQSKKFDPIEKTKELWISSQPWLAWGWEILKTNQYKSQLIAGLVLGFLFGRLG